MKDEYRTFDSSFLLHPSFLLLHVLDHRLDRVRRALLVKIIQHLADAGEARQRGVELFLVEAEELRRLRGGDRCSTRLSGEHAHLAAEVALAQLCQVDAAA